MSLINTGGKAVALTSGVGLKQIKEKAILFVKNKAEIDRMCDEVSCAYVIHVMDQGPFRNGGKGDLSHVKDWAEILFAQQDGYYSSFKKFVKKALGVDIVANRKDEDDPAAGWFITVELSETRNINKLTSDFDAVVREALKTGIAADTSGKYRKVEAPKARKSNGNNSSNSNVENGEATSKTPAEMAVEDAGLGEAFENLANSGKAKTLSTYGKELAEMIDLLAQLEDTNSGKQLLNNSIKSLQGYISKAKAKLQQEAAEA